MLQLPAPRAGTCPHRYGISIVGTDAPGQCAPGYPFARVCFAQPSPTASRLSTSTTPSMLRAVATARSIWV